MLMRGLAATFLLSIATSAWAEPASHLEVPPGFTVEFAAGEPQVRFPMFAAFDESGRLFVAEASGLDLYAELQAQTRKCRVSLLEDRDGDGRFESSRVFADKLIFPMGLAWRDGKLYVADPPDLVTYEDLDADGTADQRTVILTGFGHQDNGSLHGLVFGRDGWLYMTMGSPDGYRLERPDGSLLEGESGALIRCRPDGADPQVLCRGFVNLVEVVFTPRGDAIGTDNWFRNVNEPGSEGLRDALVHLVPGGLYPYHHDVGTPQPITGDPLGAVALFPAVAVSGLTEDRGPTFPAEFRGNLFSAQHNARRVGRHVLVANGSSFRSEDHDFLTSADPDFHPSDVLQAADGSLLVVDTGSWYTQHCPTGNIRQSTAPGGIYRVRWKAAASVRDPWGGAEDWASASYKRLIALLSNERPAVRDRAHLALVARGEAAVAPLAAALQTTVNAATKQRIVWTLASIASDQAREAIRSMLGDADAVATTAARALATLHDRAAAAALYELLARPSPHARRAAAEALATCGTLESLPVLWRALAGEPDRFLEHAVVHAIHRLADNDALLAMLSHEHPRVQRAALLLLNQPPRPPKSLPQEAVFARVRAADPELRRIAVSILQEHPEWNEHAIELVRSYLEEEHPSEEHRQSLHGLILALQSEPALQELVAAAILDHTGAHRQRKSDLLRALADCSLPAPPDTWIEAVRQAMRFDDAQVRQEAVRAAALWRVRDLDEPLARISESEVEPVEVRLDALSGVIAHRPELSSGVFQLLIEQLAGGDPLARLRAAELAGRADFTPEQLEQLLNVIGQNPLISPSVLIPALERSVTAGTRGQIIQYFESSLRQRTWRPPVSQLGDVLRSLNTSDAEAQALLALVEQGAQDARAELDRYELLLGGGNPDHGREVFFGSKVACGSCHRIGDRGGSVGPDLTRIGAVRSGRDLVESIVFPSSTFAQGYESYLLTTVAGRTMTGAIAQQSTELIVLADSSGTRHRVAKAEVESLERQSVSLMPAGLAEVMTREEFCDLLAFLQTLR
jgi:putative heme-binding domain-containing protein